MEYTQQIYEATASCRVGQAAIPEGRENQLHIYSVLFPLRAAVDSAGKQTDSGKLES